MCLVTCFVKSLLGILNFIILLVGLAVAALGAILQASASTVLVYFFEATIMTILRSLNILGSSNFFTDLDFSQLFNDAGIILLVFGLAIAAVGLIGYIGTSCGIRIILIVYTIILGVLIIAQIVVVIVLFTALLDSLVAKPAKKSLDKYVEIDDSNLTSVVWNVIMLDFQCCGFDNYTDFYKSESWRRTAVLTIDGKPETVNLTTPVACCATYGGFPNLNFVNETYCATKPDDTVSNWKKGCWNTIMDKFRLPAALIISAGIVIQLILLIVCIMVLKIDKSKTDPI